MYPFGRGGRCFRVADADNGTQESLFKDSRLLQHGGKPRPKLDVKYLKSAGDVHNDRDLCLPTDRKIHTRCRIVLTIVGGHIVHFESTYALSRYMLDAVKAHFSATTVARVECLDISASNIIILPKSDGANISLLIDWECSKDLNQPGLTEYKRMPGTPRQFMAARLCGENVPTTTGRTVGDDLESFVLLFLWIAIKYAQNTLTPHDRATLLEPFECKHRAGKVALLRNGESTVSDLSLVSGHFEELLGCILIDGYQFRYAGMLRGRTAVEREALKRKQDLLESHEWLMDTIRSALENEAWKVCKDPSEMDRKVET